MIANWPSPSRALWLAVSLVLSVSRGFSADAPKNPPTPPVQVLPDDPDKAWAAVLESAQPPRPPAEWNQKKPTQAEYEQFRLKMGEAAGVSADRAREFAERWPKHAKAAEAQAQRRRMLTAAVQLGVVARAEELKGMPEAENASGSTAAAPAAPPESGDVANNDGEFQQRMQAAAREAMKLQDQGMEAVALQFEKGLRALDKEMPGRPQFYMGMMEVAEILGGERGLQILQEILKAEKAPANVREAAEVRSKGLKNLGKPIALQFKAVDGREFDLAKLKGKVVLVDFWATWCGPCRVEIPNVRAAYQELNPKGFEIVGISFDQDKETLMDFVKQNQMPWTQYFDGEGWGNKFGKEFGISGIPTMWLIDKKGNLRDMNARAGLTTKVQKLLAED